MKIDRHNYEECFILYWDNELSLSQKQAVENFVKDNPDLQQEFSLLGDTRFAPDNNIQFEEKNFLLNSSSINVTNYEEQLLNYIDDELSNQEREDIERSAAKFPLVQKELLLLQKTKLQPEEVSFPHKSSLYRREEKVRIISMKWFRVAAAAAIILVAGFTVLQLVNSNNNSIDPTVAKTDEIKTQPVIKTNGSQAPDVDPKSTVKDTQQDLTARAKSDDRKKTSPLDIKNDIEPANDPGQKSFIAVNQSENKNNLPTPRKELVGDTEGLATNKTSPEVDLPLVKKEFDEVEKTAPVNTSLQNDDVTNKPELALYIPGPEKERGGGLKEFLRKTTRVFERRTKIQTTTEDNKLLVGAFAVSLK
jgi:hypothetical protein